MVHLWHTLFPGGSALERAVNVDDLRRLASRITLAYVHHHNYRSDALPGILDSVYRSLLACARVSAEPEVLARGGTVKSAARRNPAVRRPVAGLGSFRRLLSRRPKASR